MTNEPRYSVTIEWSDEDEVFIARVPELPGCAAHGSTHEQALKEIAVAMSLWLDVARERGRPIPAPRTVTAAA